MYRFPSFFRCQKSASLLLICAENQRQEPPYNFLGAISSRSHLPSCNYTYLDLSLTEFFLVSDTSYLQHARRIFLPSNFPT